MMVMVVLGKGEILIEELEHKIYSVKKVMSLFSLLKETAIKK